MGHGDRKRKPQAQARALCGNEIPVVLGGTLTEIAIRQGRVDGLIAWLSELGLRHVEISDGTIDALRRSSSAS